jgi:hypothetical protein
MLLLLFKEVPRWILEQDAINQAILMEKFRVLPPSFKGKYFFK